MRPVVRLVAVLLAVLATMAVLAPAPAAANPCSGADFNAAKCYCRDRDLGMPDFCAYFVSQIPQPSMPGDPDDACWSCGIFERFFDAGSRLSAEAYTEISDGALALLGAGLLLWIAFTVGKSVASVAEIDPSDLWRSLAVRLGWGMFAAVLLQAAFIGGSGSGGSGARDYGAELAFDYSINLVMNTSIELSQAMVRAAGGSAMSACSPSDFDADPDFSASGTKAFDDGAKQGLTCLLKSLNRLLGAAMTTGGALIYMAPDRPILETDVDLGLFTISLSAPIKISDPLFIVCGLLIMGVFAIIGILFPIYLIDSIIRLAIVGVMMPIWIVSFVFESTRKFSADAFKMALSAAVTLFMMTVVLAFATEMIIGTVRQQFNDAGAKYMQLCDPARECNTPSQRWASLSNDDMYSWDEMGQAYSLLLKPLRAYDDDPDVANVIEDDFITTGSTFWVLMALGVVSIFTLSKVSGLADHFTGGVGGGGSGQQTASLFGSASIGAVVAAPKMALAVKSGGAAAYQGGKWAAGKARTLASKYTAKQSDAEKGEVARAGGGGSGSGRAESAGASGSGKEAA